MPIKKAATGGILSKKMFLNILQIWKPVTLLKRDFNTGVFQ